VGVPQRQAQPTIEKLVDIADADAVARVVGAGVERADIVDFIPGVGGEGAAAEP